MKLIDVSFRESVYTNTIFQYTEVIDIIKYMIMCNLDNFFSYVEFGYIDKKKTSIPLAHYDPLFIKEVKQILKGKLKLSAMLHTDDFSPTIWDKNVIRLIDMIRIVINGSLDSNIKNVAQYFHDLGIEISLNCAYISRRSDDEIISMLHKSAESGIDIFYLADTNGSMFPEDIERLLLKIKKENTGLKIGFHAHNHFQLATANFISALKNEIDFLDSSICGYGKGAGNLKTELLPMLLSKMNYASLTEKDIENLQKLVTHFKNYIKQNETDDFQNIFFAYKNLTLKEIK